MDSNRNLLFGILALQMDFISREQLVAATSVWLLDKSKSIEDILIEQGALSEADAQMLAPLVARHVQNHGGDPEKSLAAISSIAPSVREKLKSLGDAQIDASLAIVAKDRDDEKFAKTHLSDVNPFGHTVSFAHPTTGDSRYRILRPHAKGGLGEVSVAEDIELGREVALKEIQSQFADDDVSRSRFVLEAEVTGGLEHPGIVPIYGLGQYEDGRPYYAMRFIRGDSLKEAADQFHGRAQTAPDFESIEFRKLLGRFVDVCNAIEYAHSRGVLHRDLKPGNIMLGKYGETLVVDWGLAKVKGRDDATRVQGETTLSPRSGSDSAPTQMGSAIGTPAFMPPEQAAGRLDELGPASDVYSLGATLYYLLTGQSPVTGDSLGQVLKRVETGEFTAPRGINRDIPKPLEAVCLKAMANAQGDRYESPQALAEDLECYLADETVSAFREPLMVRTKRWMRKHPGTLSAIAATILVGLTSTMVIVGVVSGKNRELATANDALASANSDLDQRNVELAEMNTALQTAENTARNEAAIARAVNSFINEDLLRQASPDEQPDRDVTLREVLDRAAESIGERFEDQPLVEAAIRQTIGEAYHELGEYQTAEPHLQRARELREKHLGFHHADTLTSVASVASLENALGHLKKGRALHETVLAERRKLLGSEHPDTLASEIAVADILYDYGQYDEAEQFMEHVLSIQKTLLGPNHRETLQTRAQYANILKVRGRYREAESTLQDVLTQQRQQLTPDHPEIIGTLERLADLRDAQGHERDAEEIYREILAVKERVYGPDHHTTLVTREDVAGQMMLRGKLTEAETLLREVYQTRLKKFGPDHFSIGWSLDSIASVYTRLQRFDKAMQYHEDNIAFTRRTWGENSPQARNAKTGLAWAYYYQGLYKKAIPIFESQLEDRRDAFGPEHPNTLRAQANLASNYLAAGRVDEADSLSTEALEIASRDLGLDNGVTWQCMNIVSVIRDKQGRYEDALAIHKQLVAHATAVLGENYVNRLIYVNNLVNTYEQMHEYDKALTYRLRLVEVLRIGGIVSWEFSEALGMLAFDYLMSEQYEEAEPIARESLAIREREQPDELLTFNMRGFVGWALLGQKKYAEAEPLLLDAYSGMEQRTDANDIRLRRIVERLIELYDQQGLTDKSQQWKEQFAALKAASARANELRAEASELIKSGDLSQAISRYQQIGELPAYQVDHDVISWLYARQFDWKAAMDAWKQQTSTDQTRRSGLHLVMELAYQLDDDEEFQQAKALALAQADQVTDSLEAEHILKGVLLKPLNDGEHEAVETLMDVVALKFSADKYRQQSIRLGEYRLGKSKAEWDTRPLESKDRTLREQAAYHLIQHGENPNQETARRLAEVMTLLEVDVDAEIESGSLGRYWWDHVSKVALIKETQHLLRETGHWGDAQAWIAELNKAATKADELRSQAEKLVEKDEIAAALALYEQIAELPGQELDLAATRELYARTMQWERALDAFEKTNDFRLAYTLYQVGRYDDYHDALRKQLANHKDFNGDWRTNSFLQLALLQPIANDLHEAVYELALENAATNTSYRQKFAGLAMYRLGRFTQWYAELGMDSPVQKNQDPLVVAIDRFANDPSDDHRRSLEQAIDKVQAAADRQLTNGQLDTNWREYLVRLSFIREAKRVLNESSQETLNEGNRKE